MAWERMDSERLIASMSEAIDRTILDPAQWPGVLAAVCGALPGTKATIHLADTRDRSSYSATWPTSKL